MDEKIRLYDGKVYWATELNDYSPELTEHAREHDRLTEAVSSWDPEKGRPSKQERKLEKRSGSFKFTVLLPIVLLAVVFVASAVGSWIVLPPVDRFWFLKSLTIVFAFLGIIVVGVTLTNRREIDALKAQRRFWTLRSVTAADRLQLTFQGDEQSGPREVAVPWERLWWYERPDLQGVLQFHPKVSGESLPVIDCGRDPEARRLWRDFLPLAGAHRMEYGSKGGVWLRIAAGVMVGLATMFLLHFQEMLLLFQGQFGQLPPAVRQEMAHSGVLALGLIMLVTTHLLIVARAPQVTRYAGYYALHFALPFSGILVVTSVWRPLPKMWGIPWNPWFNLLVALGITLLVLGEFWAFSRWVRRKEEAEADLPRSIEQT